MIRSKISRAMRIIRRRAIEILDPELVEAEKNRSRYREEKKQFWLEKSNVRKAQGRRQTRQNNKIKASKIRQKFEPVTFFEEFDGVSYAEGFEPHRGNHEIGLWQLNFLKSKGLEPHHHFLDVGCGDLKGGVPLIRYLNEDRYFGLDQNPIAIQQGHLSLSNEDRAKYPSFLIGGDFGIESVGETFNTVWAHSVFSHIDLSLCGKCMASVFKVLDTGGTFYASYFAAPDGDFWIEPSVYREEGIREIGSMKLTYSFRNPYHHDTDLLIRLANSIGYKAWKLDEETPKGQAILAMSRE